MPETSAVGSGPVLPFVDLWNSEREPFDGWVRDVAEAYTSSRLQLEAAARFVRVTPAELEAVLRLATMEDETLALLNDAIPPKTTWFDLAEASPEGVVAALEALSNASRSDAPSEVVAAALSEIEGPKVAEKIAALDAAVFGHLASKAKQYDLLNGTSRKFLVDVAKRKRTGRPPTARQAAWVENCIRELVEGGALRRDSPDGDQQLVDAALDAVSE